MSGPKRCDRCKAGRMPDRVEVSKRLGGIAVSCGYCNTWLTDASIRKMLGPCQVVPLKEGKCLTDHDRLRQDYKDQGFVQGVGLRCPSCNAPLFQPTDEWIPMRRWSDFP